MPTYKCQFCQELVERFHRYTDFKVTCFTCRVKQKKVYSGQYRQAKKKNMAVRKCQYCEEMIQRQNMPLDKPVTCFGCRGQKKREYAREYDRIKRLSKKKHENNEKTRDGQL